MEAIRIIEKNNRFILQLFQDRDGAVKLMKSVSEAQPSLDSQAQLQNEFKVAGRLKHESIRQVLGESFYEKRKCLLLEYIEGENLKQIGLMDLGTFFRFALQLAAALKYIHDEGVIHRDISVYNILFNQVTNQFQLIDFGLAVSKNDKYQPDSVIGTPAYSSPELTGRLQRQPDQRVDLYSIGVVFYEMLTGGNPFRDVSDMQTIYKQIALLPEPPHEINTAIPITVSRIVMKLIAKDPDHRYRGAAGLIYDLEEAQLLFHRNIIPMDFEPGSSEKPPPYNETPEMIGYKNQQKLLFDQFNNMLNGRSQLSWLTGTKGIGKSTLVHSLLPKFFDHQVMYLNIGTGSGSVKPYAFLFELFEAILQRIDEETEEQILKRKIRFSAENISDVSFLVDEIPSLSRFITKKNISQDHGSIQSQNRYQLALQDLLRVLAIPDRPIIAHFTSSDHKDKESANFFSKFVKDVPQEFIWIIFEHGVDENVPKDHQIHLDGLSENEMEQLFRKMISGEIRSEEKMLEYIQSYAGSVPGKLIYLVRYWYEQQFFEFDNKRKYWFWHHPDQKTLFPEAIQSVFHIQDPVERDVLEWASLIEGSFTIHILDRLSEYDRSTLTEALQSLNIKNHILAHTNSSLEESYKLTSRMDPIILIPDQDTRIKRHIAIVNELTLSGEDPYRLAYHANKSLETGDNTFKGEAAVRFNLQAGLKAKDEGAFHLARHYFKMANQQLEFLKSIDLKTSYTLYLNHAELTALDGEHEEAVKIFDLALKSASDPLEKAEVYTSQMMLYNHQGDHEASLRSGMKALETIGFPVPEKANRIMLIRKLALSWIRLRKKDPMDMLKLPQIEDKKVILSLRIMENLHTALFNKSSELLLIVLLISMERILKYGNAPEGYSAYAGFGAVLALGFSNYKKGWAFTIAGTEMTNQFNNKLYQGRGLFAKGAWMINYITHTKESIPVLEEGIELSKESGDFSYATNGYTNLQEALFMAGIPLESMEKKVDEMIAFTYQIGYDDILALSLSSKLYCMRLSNREHEFEALLEQRFNGRNLEQYTIESSFKHIRIYYLILDAYWNFFNGNYEKGLEDIKLSKPLLYTLQGPAIIVDYYVIRGLLNYESYLKTQDKKALKYLKNSITKLRKYAKLVPANFEHRYNMLKALEIRLKGKLFDARELMREALVLAREHEYLQIEGICASYLSRWFNEMGQKDYAWLHFRDSINVFAKWQSPFLTGQINSEFQTFVTLPSSSTSRTASSSTFQSGHSGFSNPEVLMQSALNVAAETDFESLLDVMNRIFVEQAGASRSLLFIRSGKELRLLYAMENDRKSFHTFPGKPINEVKAIPMSILSLVLRTQETLIINDTSNEQRFRFEPYLRNADPFSIMVTPLVYRGDLTGIIYFENNLLTNAFSERRQELLNLLSGQFAVSLQNARLVEELEHRVKERTLALESEKDRADHLLKNILPAETAEELKIRGKATSRYHEKVTVIFTDFIGFTKTSEKMHPESLVKMLDYYFRTFDKIIGKHGLEKIKTIGDAYLCVSGLPIFHNGHAVNAIRAALEILRFVESSESKEHYGLEIRIGIHSGPVVAGVVGEEKFAFDIWGDTVNTASRMETNSESGKINISKETMDLLQSSGDYSFTYRGKIKAKNKGEIDMYFIEENQTTLMDHQSAIQHILDKMSNELSDELHYHSIEHTHEIMESARKIGIAEGLNDMELSLLATAAAYHDSGFLISVNDHEEKSTEVVADLLPDFGFSASQIRQIQNMIIATRIPQQPKDLLSKVLCDADLYYIGTDSFFETGEKLYEEFSIQGVVNNRQDWIALQIRFLESHHYFTQTAKTSCDAPKQKHLEELKKMLDVSS